MTVNGEHSIHSTGQPDTPVEALVDLLGRALAAPDQAEMRGLVERAYKLVAGLDPYLDAVSTPPAPVSACTRLLWLAHAPPITAFCPDAALFSEACMDEGHRVLQDTTSYLVPWRGGGPHCIGSLMRYKLKLLFLAAERCLVRRQAKAWSLHNTYSRPIM